MGRIIRFLVWLVLTLIVAIVAVVIALSVQGGFIGGYGNQATIILTSVQQMSVLTTTRYNYSGLVTSEREMPALLAPFYGERQVLVAVGHITAGIDLSQLTAENVTLANGNLTLTLPPPTLQDCFLNEGASYIAERDTGIFNRAAPNLDVEARRYAVGQFRDQALENGILNDAQTQAQTAISQFIAALNLPNVQTVNVVASAPDPAAPLPQSCQ